MSRNITIVVVILIIVLLAFYLVWLRNKYSNVSEPIKIEVSAQPTFAPLLTPPPGGGPTPISTPSASPSSKKTASPSAKPK